MTTPITATVRLENGSLLTEANMGRIVARSSRLCTNVIHPKIDPKTYREKWVIRKDPEGFIFVEVTHGGGICGHARNVRQLVIKTLFGLSGDISVEVEDL